MSDKYCHGCKYYRMITDDLRYCSYILDENKRRPCPPGKGCTVKQTRRKTKCQTKKGSKCSGETATTMPLTGWKNWQERKHLPAAINCGQ